MSGNWTKDEIALLGKISDKTIAKKTGRALTTVWRMRHRLGVESSEKSRKDISELRRLAVLLVVQHATPRHGLQADLAKLLGVTRQAICDIITRQKEGNDA